MQPAYMLTYDTLSQAKKRLWRQSDHALRSSAPTYTPSMLRWISGWHEVHDDN